jgi:hypothetical protein
MSDKSLAQLEIGSPEWTAKRQALIGNGGNAAPAPEMSTSALALGVLALATSALVLGALRLRAMMGKRA